MQKNVQRSKKTSRIAIMAMLTAISVVLGIVCKNLFTFGLFYRFTLENIGAVITGVFFGPLSGAIVGLASDTVSCLLSSNPALNPILSLGAALAGIVPGAVARYFVREHGMKQFILADAGAQLIGQVAVKSVGKMVYFGMPWYGIFVGLFFGALACVIEAALIRLIWKNREINKLIIEASSK